MIPEFERAAQEFRGQLQGVFEQLGDNRDRKRTLLDDDKRITDGENAQADRAAELAYQLKAQQGFDGTKDLLQRPQLITERTAGQSVRWQELEVGRRDIFNARMSFDQFHLERISQGRANADSQIPIKLEVLDEMHQTLKDSTAEYFDGWYRSLDRNDADVQALGGIRLEGLPAALRDEVAAFVDTSTRLHADRREWIDRIERHYSNAVYRFDGEYRRIRAAMERWEPLNIPGA